MVCSACGFDNPSAMRFCGMCGIPLPHRPITAPGAQSTLNFTRVPVDMGVATRGRGSDSERRTILVETPSANEDAGSTSVLDELHAKELVPDIPLDEYVQGFRYEPPQDTAEVTMRGEAHPAPPPRAARSDEHNIIASRSAREAVAKASDVVDVDSRLGLEPESPAEAAIQRPRFLDINEPSREAPPVSSGTSSIAGPSFLGLNDAPQTWADAIGVEYKPRSGHWRVWIAVAVAVIVVVLAGLEWRSQSGKTFAAGAQVLATKVRSLWHQAVPQDGDTSNNDAESHAAPVVQVPSQTTPPASAPTVSAESSDASQPSDQNAVASADKGAESGSVATPRSSTQNSATTSENKPVEPGAAAGVPKGPTREESAEQAAAIAKPKRQASSSDQEAAASQAAPGGEEMSKAKNASDAAATAAWLWKATAKGNPDAPVQLANMYIQGNGVPRSCEQAVVLLKTAAAKQNAGARNRLAWMYSTGTCIARNRVEAYRWFNAALDANPNSQWAQQNRTLVWQQMTPEERAAAGDSR